MMLTLMKILPLLIGHLVPEDCPYWMLFKLLREITDIVMSPVMSLDATYYIEEVVRDHHCQFLRLFPECHLTPKHHFMVHYGEAIRRCGPLRHLWCMRYESKHQAAKKVGDLSNNFKNIALTVATQYTLTSFSKWELDDIWPTTTVGQPLDGDFLSSVCYRGVLFKPGCVVCHGVSGENPVLSIVTTIECNNSQFAFNCTKLVVSDFSEHFCAYPVANSDSTCRVLLRDLTYTLHMFTHFNFRGESFVFLPYRFGSKFTSTSLY